MKKVINILVAMCGAFCAAVAVSADCQSGGAELSSLDLMRQTQKMRALVEETKVVRTAPKEKIHVEIAVSLSLEGAYLRDLASFCREVREMEELNTDCRLVVRGLAVKETKHYFTLSDMDKKAHTQKIQAAALRLAQAVPETGAEIDPAFFKRFRIEAVPVHVISTSHGAFVLRGGVTPPVLFESLKSVAAEKAPEALKELSPLIDFVVHGHVPSMASFVSVSEGR